VSNDIIRVDIGGMESRVTESPGGGARTSEKRSVNRAFIAPKSNDPVLLDSVRPMNLPILLHMAIPRSAGA
jgi:hypothetical protein